MAKLRDKQAKKEWDLKIKYIRENTGINPFETKEDQQKRIARAKKDYRFFVSYYLPHYATAETPDKHVKFANRMRKNKVISRWNKWGRALAKSVVGIVTTPLWLWINDDIFFAAIIGQNETKAQILLDDLMAEFEGNQRLIHDFGVQHNPGHWESGFFITKNGFIAKALGMGQDPRGLRVGPKRPDYIECDDWETRETQKNPLRQDEYAKWLLTAVIPIMDGMRERVVLSQNHFAPRMIFSKIVEENEGWEVDQWDAFDPVTLKPVWSKYPENFFKEKMKKIGILNLKAEYNNEPYVKGKYFTDKMIQWTKLPRLNSFTVIVGTWDVAFAGSATSDYNAVRVWGLHDGRKILVDCFVARSKIRQPLEWMAAYQMSLPKTVSVQFRYEKQFHNDEIEKTIREVEREYGIVLNLVQMERDKRKKFDRIMEMNPQYQNGRIYYNAALKDHNHTKEGLNQLKQIEPGYKGNDDAPDADKYAFDYLDQWDRQRTHTHTFKRRESRKF